MNSTQLILAVETNQKTDSDYMYISSFIKHYFTIDPLIKLSPVYMDGKGNFNCMTVQKQIAKYRHTYHSRSIILYCYDTDNLDTDPNDLDFDKRITEFCSRNNYRLVHFSKDIEDVFLGRRVSTNNKKQEAINFLKHKKVEQLDLRHFSSENKKVHHSNLFLVLKQIMPEMLKK